MRCLKLLLLLPALASAFFISNPIPFIPATRLRLTETHGVQLQAAAEGFFNSPKSSSLEDSNKNMRRRLNDVLESSNIHLPSFHLSSSPPKEEFYPFIGWRWVKTDDRLTCLPPPIHGAKLNLKSKEEVVDGWWNEVCHI